MLTTTDGTPYWLAVARQIGIAQLVVMCPGLTAEEVARLEEALRTDTD